MNNMNTPNTTAPKKCIVRVSLTGLFFVLSAVTLFFGQNASANTQASTTLAVAVQANTSTNDVKDDTSNEQENTNDTNEDLSTTTRNLRERIERIVEERRDQIKGVLTEIDSHRRGIIGEVQRVTEDSFTIRNHIGTEIIPFTNTTYPVSILKNGEDIPFDEVAVGDWLLALGVMENTSFQPIRILVSEESFRPRTRSVSIGSISEFTRDSITIEHRDGSQITQYNVNQNTVYQDLTGEPIERADIIESMQAVVAGLITNDDNENGNGNESSTRLALSIKVLTTIQESE